MNKSLPAYQLVDDFRLVSLDDDAEEANWSRGLQTEEIGKGWHLNLFDLHVAQEEVLAVQGPATFSISLFLSGSGRVALDNGPALDIEPGSLFLFHATRSTRGLKHVHAGSHMRGLDFRFSPMLLDTIGLQSLGCLVRAFSDNGSVQDALLMRRELNAPLQCIAHDVLACRMTGAARRMFLQSKALELLAHIIACCEVEPPMLAALRKPDQRRVQQAAEILQRRYSDPWTIAGLAREVGINERKLKQGFRQVLGRTIHDHLERTRISAAQTLLAEEGLSVTEAALAVGYSTPSHFAKVFKRRVGTSPSVWRRTASEVP